MTVVVNTGHGYVSSYHEAWKQGTRPVWTWRVDGAEAHDFGTVEAAEKWIDEVFHLESVKVRNLEGWTVEVVE